jgi:hypothetical protein
MDHDFTTAFNHHPKQIWWKMKNKCIMKVHAWNLAHQPIKCISHYIWMNAMKELGKS